MSLVVKGKVWKFGNNISTDLMMPGFAVLTRPNMKPEEMAKYVMYSNRPGWVEQVKPGDIIVGGKNFGCGSSRPAALALKVLGISCVIAESIGRIFFRNSINLGFPVMIASGITEFFGEDDLIEANFTTGEIKNITTGKTMKAKPLPKNSPPMKILEAGGINALLKKEYSERKR